MRRALVVPMLVLLTACGGEGVHRSFRPSLEGQSPPEPPPPPATPKFQEPPAANSAAADSPAWLRQNSPIEWTNPPGWEAELSTKPNRMFEFTLEKNGPGSAPIQFLILKGGDDQPDPMKFKVANLDKWETSFHEDIPRTTNTLEHDGLKITRIRVHGTYEGPIYPPSPALPSMVNEQNWTMIGGWIETANGSVLFRLQGPDAIVKPAEAKVDQLLASMKPRQKQ